MKQHFLLMTLFSLILAACSGATGATSGGTAVTSPASTNADAAEPRPLVFMSHDSFAISEDVLKAFETEHNVVVELLPAGDAGAALNQAILTKEVPLADVFFGVDNTFMGRALAAGIFEPYQSPQLAEIPDALELDDTYHLLPVDFGDVCLNYDKAWFAEQGLAPPQTLADLTSPAYKGLLVAENPATSSPGLAFLFVTIAQFGVAGEYTYLDYWADLRANEILITNGWEDAYYGYFTAASAVKPRSSAATSSVRCRSTSRSARPRTAAGRSSRATPTIRTRAPIWRSRGRWTSGSPRRSAPRAGVRRGSWCSRRR